MRRTFSYVLVALGTALVLLGLLAKFVVYDRRATVALNQNSTSVSEGTGMQALRIWGEKVGDTTKSHFDRLTNAHLQSTRKVVGMSGAIPSDKLDDLAMWQTGVTSKALSADGLSGETIVTMSQEYVTFNRKTGETTASTADLVSAGDLDDPKRMIPVKHEGLFFKLPFNAEKTTYRFWDGDLGKATDLRFVREEQIEGTPVYVYEQKIDKQAAGEPREIPLAVVGASGDGNTTAQMMYGNTRTLWVEPNTGAIVKGQEQIDKELVSDQGSVVVTRGTIGYTDATVKANAADLGTKGRLLGLLNGGLMPILVGLGLLSLVAAYLLGRRRAPMRHAAPRSTPAAPVGPTRSTPPPARPADVTATQPIDLDRDGRPERA